MWKDIVITGGPIVWLIAVAGLLAFGVFIERALHLHRARIKSEDFLKGIFNILQRQNPGEALKICEGTPGPVAHVTKIAIRHRGDSHEALRIALEEAGNAELSRMERRLVVVATVAQIAPLLGLLGTVLGLVEVVWALQVQSPLVQSMDVTGGLLHALLTTGAGLMVAIPCYAAFNLLVIKVDRIVLDMDRAIAEMIGFFAGSRSEEAIAPEVGRA